MHYDIINTKKIRDKNDCISNSAKFEVWLIILWSEFNISLYCFNHIDEKF